MSASACGQPLGATVMLRGHRHQPVVVRKA
jgi:hypothetical protein